MILVRKMGGEFPPRSRKYAKMCFTDFSLTSFGGVLKGLFANFSVFSFVKLPKEVGSDMARLLEMSR